jgi:TIR domain
MRIFISHSSVDRAFVNKLALSLEKRGAKCWVDEAEMRPGDSLLGKLSLGLNECEFVAVVLSPDAVTSVWVNQELEAALIREFSDRGLIVIPILYRDCEIPVFLRTKIWVDFRDVENDGPRFDQRVDVMLAQLNQRPKRAAIEPEPQLTQVIARRRETIRVILVDAVRGDKFQIEVPVDASGDAVKQALVKRLALPTSFSDGQPVLYNIVNKRTNGIVLGHRSLRDNDVLDGDVLSIFVQMMAG